MGTLIGSTFRDAQAIEFNGSTQYAYVDDPSFKSDTQGAFAFWYRPTTALTTTAFERIIGYGTTNAANDSAWAIEQRWINTGTIAIPYRSNPIPGCFARITNGGTNNLAYGDHIFTAATWVHIVLQSNGTSWDMWLNGVDIGPTAWLGTNTGDWLGDVSGSNHRLTFGCAWISNAALQFNDNRTNECIYISRPLTSGEITALYNGGTPRNPHRVTTLGADWKSWWRFGDSRDNATTVFDERGSNNLTLVASPSYVTP